MEFGICTLSVVPVRKEPSDTSEMTTQLLFGDLITQSDAFKNWHKIRIVSDNYEGWIDNKQYTHISLDEFNRINNCPNSFSTDIVQIIKNEESGKLLPLLLGSQLNGIKDNRLSIKDDSYYYEGLFITSRPDKNKIIEFALLYTGSPYLWGGKTPFGIDCSGLTQMVYKLAGISILRDAAEQSQQGETVNFISEAEPGDLAFFDDEEESIIHVGIILPDNKIIHAHGQVRTDELDHQGIFDKASGNYTHNLRTIKRII